MSSIDYSTANADYRQIYAVHTIPLKDSIFESKNFDSIDAVVLEAYHSEAWFDKFWISEYKGFHDALFQNAQKTAKPIYVVDVLTTRNARTFESYITTPLDFIGLFVASDGISNIKQQLDENRSMTRRQFLRFWTMQPAKIAFGSYLFSHFLHEQYTVNTGHNPEFLARINSVRMHMVPTPQFELRNAISARKIEEYIVPELKKKLGRNPRVLLVYGAGHSGLKEDLEHPKLRDFYIRLYSEFGFSGIDTTYLDTVTNLSIDKSGKYSLEHRKANLF